MATPPKMRRAHSSVVAATPPSTVACTCISVLPGRIRGSITRSCQKAMTVPGTLVTAIHGCGGAVQSCDPRDERARQMHDWRDVVACGGWDGGRTRRPHSVHSQSMRSCRSPSMPTAVG